MIFQVTCSNCCPSRARHSRTSNHTQAGVTSARPYVYASYILNIYVYGRKAETEKYTIMGWFFFQAQHFKHILYVLRTWIVIFHVTKITHNLYLFQVLSFLRIISADRVYTCQVYTLTLRFWHQFIFSGWSLENWIKEKLPLIIIRKWEILQFGFF